MQPVADIAVVYFRLVNRRVPVAWVARIANAWLIVLLKCRHLGKSLVKACLARMSGNSLARSRWIGGVALRAVEWLLLLHRVVPINRRCGTGSIRIRCT